MYNYSFYYAKEKYHKTYYAGALTKNNKGFYILSGSHYTYYKYICVNN